MTVQRPQEPPPGEPDGDLHADEDLLAALEKVRDLLRDGTTSPDAPQLAADVAAGLEGARALPPGPSREEAVDDILALLARHPLTRDRLGVLLPPGPDAFLGHGTGELARSVGAAPLGDASVVFDRYECPQCRRVWVVLDADDDQPSGACPSDGAQLRFVPAEDG
jgi:hypothetical protein